MAVLERAITYREGPHGQREVCARPVPVLEMAHRLHQWRNEAETCKSCQTLPALSVIGGIALCSRCREQRAVRFMDTSLPSAHARRLVEDDQPALQGLAIVFNSRSVDLGGFVEIIKPEAVDRTIRSGLDLRYLWNHNPDLPLGRMSAGNLTVRKDSGGLWVDNRPPRSAYREVESVERRDVVGQSFGFVAITDDWHLEDRDIVREVLDMEVHEASATPFPAYPATSLRVVNADQRTREAETMHRVRMAR